MILRYMRARDGSDQVVHRRHLVDRTTGIAMCLDRGRRRLPGYLAQYRQYGPSAGKLLLGYTVVQFWLLSTRSTDLCSESESSEVCIYSDTKVEYAVREKV